MMQAQMPVAGTRLGSRGNSRLREAALCVAALLWFAACYALAGRAARGLAGPLGDDYEGLLASAMALFLVVYGARAIDRVGGRGAGRGEVLALPRRKGWAGEFGVGAAVGWGMAVAAVLPVLLSGNLHAHVGVTARTVGVGALGLLTLGVVCLLEEVVARGYAFRRLIAAIGEAWATVLMSAGLGAVLVLGDPPYRVLTALVCGTLFGVVLSIAALRTRALWVGWGLHFAYRAVAAVMFGLPIAGHTEFASVVRSYTTGRQWVGGGDYGLDAAALTVVVLLAGMAVLFRVTRDYAWNYTHVLPVGAGYAVEVAPPAAHVAGVRVGEGAGSAEPALVTILPTTPQTMTKDGGGAGE